jgi:hypothetical protein
MKKILLLLLLSFVFILPGCGSGSGSSNTCFFSGLSPNSTYLFVFNLTGGGTQSVIGVTTSTGSVVVIKPINGACNNVQIILRLNSNFTLSSNPSSIDLTSPPSTVTITGQSFDTTYGMPRVDYYDGDGYLVGSAYASSVSGSTSLTATVPDLSAAYSGSYQIKVTNKTSSGYYSHTVGTADVSAYGRDRLDSDSDGYYDDEDCDPYDPSRNVYCNDCPENPTAIICE